jgi:hypothetical protein
VHGALTRAQARPPFAPTWPLCTSFQCIAEDSRAGSERKHVFDDMDPSHPQRNFDKGVEVDFNSPMDRFAEYTTREFGHARFDYEVGWDPFRWVPYARKLHIQPVFFGDAAAILEAQSRDGTPVELDSPEWKFATGVGLQYNVLGIPGGGGQIRFDIARRLDRDDHAMTYRLRFTLQKY